MKKKNNRKSSCFENFVFFQLRFNDQCLESSTWFWTNHNMPFEKKNKKLGIHFPIRPPILSPVQSKHREEKAERIGSHCDWWYQLTFDSSDSLLPSCVSTWVRTKTQTRWRVGGEMETVHDGAVEGVSMFATRWHCCASARRQNDDDNNRNLHTLKKWPDTHLEAQRNASLRRGEGL